MITFLKTYEARKQEINNFLNFMEKLSDLEQKHDSSRENDSFTALFTFSSDGKISYTSTINMLKSNAVLMIYNIIEFSVFNIMSTIYDTIQDKELTCRDVNEYILELWIKSEMKSAYDPNASFSTLMNKTKTIIDMLMNEDKIRIQPKKVFPSGNLGGDSVKTLFEAHGMNFCSKHYRPYLLDTIKNSRNNLAHGTVSFSEAMSDKTINDIKDIWGRISSFLDDLVKIAEEYINHDKYRKQHHAKNFWEAGTLYPHV